MHNCDIKEEIMAYKVKKCGINVEIMGKKILLQIVGLWLFCHLFCCKA